MLLSLAWVAFECSLMVKNFFGCFGWLLTDPSQLLLCLGLGLLTSLTSKTSLVYQHHLRNHSVGMWSCAKTSSKSTLTSLDQHGNPCLSWSLQLKRHHNQKRWRWSTLPASSSWVSIILRTFPGPSTSPSWSTRCSSTFTSSRNLFLQEKWHFDDERWVLSDKSIDYRGISSVK